MFHMFVTPIGWTATLFKSFKWFWVIPEMMQCSCFSAQCQAVASSHPAHFGMHRSINATYTDGKRVPKRIRSSFKTNCCTPSTWENNFQAYICAHGGAPNPPLFPPTGSAFWAAALPTPRDKEMKCIGGGLVFQTVQSQDIILLLQQAK